MRAKPEYRNRDDTEVAVLDALAGQNGEGMTVFAIRTEVDADIDNLEDALANLKSDNLIEASQEDGRTMITVEEYVVGPDTTDDDEDFLDEIRRRFRL
jgi:pyrrolidone-carboxylate peptidase